MLHGPVPRASAHCAVVWGRAVIRDVVARGWVGGGWALAGARPHDAPLDAPPPKVPGTGRYGTMSRTYPPLNPNRCLRAGFYDIEQVRVGDVFLLVSQDDEAAVGHL